MKKNSIISAWLEKHGDPQIERLAEQQAKQVMKKNNIEYQYLDLLRDILENGIEKSDRTGTGTISVFGRQIRHKMSEGFPLITTKKMPFKTITTELLWFLKGDTNIKYLVDNGCHIWNGDAIKNYEKHNGEINWGPFVTKQEAFVDKILSDDEFAKKWGELGPIYGKQWRSWTSYSLRYNKIHKEVQSSVIVEDQIANLINDLKTNPDSRRLMVNAWNVGELDQMVLPPCHYGFQVYTRELSQSERFNWYGDKIGSYMHHDHIEQEMDEMNVPKRAISLMWNQRSVDTFLGLPFNIASYALLLEIIAREVNMVPDELIGNLGDVHLYKNHIEQAKEQLTRNPMPLTTIKYMDHLQKFESWLFDKRYGMVLRPKDFILDNYQSHPAIKAPLSN